MARLLPRFMTLSTALIAWNVRLSCGRLNHAYSGGEIEEQHVGVRVTNADANAYFTLIGPMDGRTYRKWLVSAIAIASAFSQLGSKSDFVILCARHRGGQSRSTDMLVTETTTLLELGVRWRYLDAPGNKQVAGFHLGNYKLFAWQHVEYERIQFLDADVLPERDMHMFFEFPFLLESRVVACPGRVSPLNAGWISFVPDRKDYAALVELLDKREAVQNNSAPWGHYLNGWYNSDGIVQNAGWEFFDALGSQGHLYSYFRFDARSLAILFHAIHFDYRVLLYNHENEGRTSGNPETPHSQVSQLLQAK